MSNWNGLGSSWQYSRWVKNLSHNARITNPTNDGGVLEDDLYREIAVFFCKPTTGEGTRPWLTTSFNKLSVTAAGSQYQFNAALEPIAVIVKAVEIIGRDLKKIPITNAEKAFLDLAFNWQEAVWDINRRYGTAPLYGNVGGSTVGVP